MIGGAREKGTGGLGKVWQSNNFREFKIMIEEEQWQLVGEPQLTRVGKMVSEYTDRFVSCPDR